MKNRGMLLEQLINKTIKKYKNENLAIFHKKEIPIKFGGVSSSQRNLKINNAFIVSKSTTDYYGIYNGLFIAFEAKSTKERSLPKNNFKIHQHKYLEKIEQHGGISFYIIYFSLYNEFYLISYSMININHALRVEKVREEGIELEIVYPGYLNIIEAIEKIK